MCYNKEKKERAMKGKKEKIGVIKGSELRAKTRGIQYVPFRTGSYQTKKDKPRDKNWRKWVD